MSNYFSPTDASTRQRTFYGKPQHDDGHVSDRDIFCESESRDNEQSLFVQTAHYAVADDTDDFARAEGGNELVRVA